MGVRGTIWRSGAAIALIGLAPALAFAHAGERGFVLLMPRGYALWGGTLAVAASFLVLLAIPEGPIRRFATAEKPVCRLPAIAPPLLSALSFALMVALIAAGLTGTRDPLENPLSLTVWTLWWGGLTAAHALFGNLWAALHPWLAPYRYEDTDLLAVWAEPSRAHVLGGDALGRDVLSRLIIGARISLLVAGSVLGLTLTIGTLAGMVAGYFGGWVDALLMRAADIVFAFPELILAIVVAAMLGPPSRSYQSHWA